MNRHHYPPALVLPGVIAALLPFVAACSLGARLAEPEPVRVASLPPPFAGFGLAAQQAAALAGGTLRLKMQSGTIWDVDSNTNAGATLAAVKLSYPCGDGGTNYGVVDPNTGAGSADTWELDPGDYSSSAWFPTGGVEFESTAYTNFRINGNGATLVWTGNSGVAGTLGVSGSRHTFSNLIVRNDGTQGSNLFIDASSNNVDNVTFVDIRIPQVPGGSAAPINFRQAASTRVNLVTLERVTLDANTSILDGVSFGGTAPTSGYGIVYLIDCFIRGCNSAANANSVSTDALGTRGVVKIVGGDYGYSGGPNIASGSILGFSGDSAGTVEIQGAKIHHGNTGFETTATGYEVYGARLVEDCDIYGCINGVVLSDHSTNVGYAVMRRTRITRDPGRDIDNTNGFNRAGVRVDAPMALIEDCIIEGYRNANAGTLHDRAIESTNGDHGRSLTIRNTFIKDCFNAVTMPGSDSGLLHMENVLITGKPKTYAATHRAISLTQGDAGTNRLAVAMSNVVTVWEPVDDSTNAVLGGSGVAIPLLSGDNYFWANANASIGSVTSGQLPATTPPLKDVSTNDPAAKPLFDDLGRELPGSPTRNRGRADSLLTALIRANLAGASQTINPDAYGFGDVSTQVAPTRLVFNVLRTADTDRQWKYGTILALSGNNSGQFRPILDNDANTSYDIITVGVPFTALPVVGDDMLLMGAPARPMSGSLNAVRDMSLSLVAMNNPWQQDALNRSLYPHSGTDTVNTLPQAASFAAAAINTGFASPGWLKAVRPRTDHRRSAPWRGHDPGSIDPLDDQRR